MTATRKQIIKLIEPYMDKTLSEGCLFIPYFGGKEYGKTSESRSTKILGHYDITAVLKYIHKYAVNIELIKNAVCDTDGDFRVQLGKVKYREPQYILPNKPLHLYSEQEEKDLLELLKKLGK